jgi:protocatechuate 3,4-dioxygenase beta subunit
VSDLTVTVAKAGFASKRLVVRARDVSAGDPVELRLEPGAAISGRVVDPSGAPVVAALVTARPLNVIDTTPAPLRASAETDDRGDYRIGGLAAGGYAVVSGPARTDGIPAPAVHVKRGDDIVGVNLVVEPPSPRAPRTEMASTSERSVEGGVLQGRVLSETGGPLERARVWLFRHGMGITDASTDADGRFVMSGVPAGRFALRGSYPGYVTLEYGQRRATEAGRTIEVRSDDTVTGLDLILPRGRAIVGSVADEHGEPVEGAVVRALQLRFVGGRTVAWRVPGVRDRRSDDRGHFRLFGLLPGVYLVSASVDAPVSSETRVKARGYAPTFYPGSADVGDAWRLQLDLQQDAFGAHIVLAPSPAVRVSGTVVDSNGRPLNGTVLLIPSARSRTVAVEPRSTTVSGGFSLTNVPPGAYVLQVFSESRAGEPTEFAAQYLNVGDVDPAPLSLTTSPGATLRGRITVDGSAVREGFTFALEPVPADFDRAPFNGRGVAVATEPGGRFTMTGLAGPTRFMMYGAPAGWYLKSVIFNGSDVTDVPFDFGFPNRWAPYGHIAISTAGPTVRGRVIDENSSPLAEYTVLVFPTDRARWFAHSRYLKFARPSQDDSFEVTGLPPGDYWVAAADAVEATAGGGEWQDPEVLEALAAGAQRVALAERDVVELTLRSRRR